MLYSSPKLPNFGHFLTIITPSATYFLEKFVVNIGPTSGGSTKTVTLPVFVIPTDKTSSVSNKQVATTHLGNPSPAAGSPSAQSNHSISRRALFGILGGIIPFVGILACILWWFLRRLTRGLNRTRTAGEWL